MLKTTSTVARVKWFYVACSKNCFLFLDIDIICDGRCKLRPAASRYAASSNSARSSGTGWLNTVDSKALPCTRSSLSTCTNYQIRIFRPQTLGGPFSAVSKPIFASKYSFCSIFRDLQYLHTFAPIQTQNVAKLRRNCFENWNIFLTKIY